MGATEIQGFDPSTWLKSSPEQELYDIYSDTIASRFHAFNTKPFADAVQTMNLPLLAHTPGEPIDPDIVDIVVTKDSFARFQDELHSHATKYGLDKHLDHNGSVVYGTDHGQFTDVPLAAEAVGHISLTERDRVLQVVSKMVGLLSTDLGKGPVDIIQELRKISNLLQTIPRLDGDPSRELRVFREHTNWTMSSVMREALRTKGAVVVESIIGRHNQESDDGQTLYIHEPNIRTVEALALEEVLVVPVYIHCPTFGADGEIVTQEMEFEISPPMQITDPRNDAHFITELFRRATERSVGDQYKNGIKIRSWKEQQAKQTLGRAKATFHRIAGIPETPSSEY